MSVNIFACICGRNNIPFILRNFVSGGWDFMFVILTFIFVLFCIECVNSHLKWANIKYLIVWFLKEGKSRERSRCIYVNLLIWGDVKKVIIDFFFYFV